MTSPSGRIRQTLLFVFAWSHPTEDNLARAYLNPSEHELYMQMSPPARQHHLRVLKRLLAQGEKHPALLKAALLHDVGKIRYPFSLPEKVLVVLVKACLPRQFAAWSNGPTEGWRRPFVVSAKHPQWGAKMALEIGVDELTVELICRHQTHLAGPPRTEADDLLQRLQAADDLS
jgi:hypothetical protein